MTAYNVPETPPTPTIRRRLASMVYDGLLLLAVIFFGFLVPNVVLGVAARIVLPRGIELFHFLFVIGIYFVWFWRRDGRTLAMKTWRIKLVAADGSRPGLDQLILRIMLAGPSILLVFGLLWALVDRDRQFLHDRLCGTRLVIA
ncbi:MAG TPA: RDD family protein [Rhodocyclaceae bacterium]